MEQMQFIREFKEVLSSIGGDAYLVGGFVRDRLINKNNMPKDIDIIYNGNLELLVKTLKNKLYKFSYLENSEEMCRAVIGDVKVNIQKMKAESIEEDLRKRDFTMNTICLKIIDNKIIDPFKGRRAIEARIIHQVTEESIIDDPIRILRGIRFYVQYGMHFNLETENAVIENAGKLNQCDKERVFYEFMKIIESDKSSRAFEFLDDYKIIQNLFPHINELKDINKYNNNSVDIFTHMNLTYQCFKDIINGIIQLDTLDMDLFKEEIDNFSLKEYTALASFLHDIGKYKFNQMTKEQLDSYKYEKVSAQISKDSCIKLGFSEKAADLIYNIIEGLMYPAELFKTGIKSEVDGLYEFFDKYNKYVPYILVVSFCDNYAESMDTDNINKEEYKVFIEGLINKYKNYKNNK